MPSADAVQHAAVGVCDHVGVEVYIDFGGAEHHRVHHRGEISLAVKVVRGERRGRDVARIAGDGAHCVEIEGLAIEDVIDQALLQHLHQVLARTAAHESRFDSLFAHVTAQVVDESQRDSPCPRLERKAIAHDSRVTEETGDHLRNQQAVR